MKCRLLKHLYVLQASGITRCFGGLCSWRKHKSASNVTLEPESAAILAAHRALAKMANVGFKVILRARQLFMAL